MTVTLQPPSFFRALTLRDNLTPVAPPSGAPAPLSFTDVNAYLFTSFTPSGTTVTLAFSTSDAPMPSRVEVTGATTRVNFCEGTALNTIRAFVAYARRKPGTTGAIAAQTVKFQGWNGSAYEEVARLNVLAAAAGADPVSDFLYLPKAAGDSRFYFAAAHPFKVLVDAADTALEIVVEAYGKA